MRSNRWEALQSLLLSLSLLFSFLSLTFSYPSLFYFHPTSVMIPSDKWYHLLGNREKTIFLVMMSSVIPGVLIRARIAGRRRRMKIAPKIFCVTVSTEFDYYLLILLIIFSLSLSLVFSSVSITESIRLAAFGSVSYWSVADCNSPGRAWNGGGVACTQGNVTGGRKKK